MSSRSFRIGRSATGLGLFAAKPIKRAAYIATYRGPRVSTEESDRRERLGAKYMFELNSRWVIDGSPRWNLARYMNHSCWPNAKPITRKGRIAFVALRFIAPGEEITYNYGPEYFEYFLQNKGCRCAGCLTKAAVRRSKKIGRKRRR
jgi:SET domain-containing protein